MKMKRLMALALCMMLALSATPIRAERSTFAADLESRYVDPALSFGTEVRWWMAEGAHTDETLLEEVQAMYDAGFRGMELCEQVEESISDADYGYGSDQWDHDLKLVLNKALDLGMTVSLTSGTNWATANIPGLDPQSQAASQVVFEVDEYLKPGKNRSGAIPMEKKVGVKKFPVQETARLIGVYAYHQTSDKKAVPAVISTEYIDLNDQLYTDENGALCLDFTPPDPESIYRIFYYWQQGAEQTSTPAVEPAYCINYFDEAGVDALRAYWEEHILDDDALNQKILEGDVQVFMDSLEINTESGFTFWAQDMEEQFMARKGYDVRPFLFLFIDLPDMFFFDHAGYGAYDLADAGLRERIMNDLFDVQTQLYMERMLTPLKAWLNSIGVKTRAQISYGQHLEISEPSMCVDYPEAENLNQNNQVDIYRLWTGAAKMQNKVLSSETGAVGGHRYTYQDHLMEAYDLYAAGFNRIIWHIWSSKYGPTQTPEWPGYKVSGVVFRSFYTFGQSEPSAVDYPLFNDHLGRVQQLLQTGKSRTDVGMLYMNYDQGTPTNGNQGGVNWMLNHEPALFPSTFLQDAGYTYDYLSPNFLHADGVSFDEASATLEQSDYKAIVLWQKWLPLTAAEELLTMAKQGLHVVILDGAAVQTPYNDGSDGALAAVMDEVKALPTTACIANADEALAALQVLGVTPYVGFTQPNHQLLTQLRADDRGEYLYVYNYCDGSYKSFWTEGAEQDDHGDHIDTEIAVEGTFIPYVIDAWSGKVTELGAYRHEDGKTIIPVSLDYGSIALYALEPCKTGVERHGRVITMQPDNARNITGWNVTVTSWTPGDGIDTRTEMLNGKTVTESAVQTVKTEIPVQLDTLTTWDNMPGVGLDVVGRAEYNASFTWDGTADGAYIDFGKVVESMRVYINDAEVSGVSMTSGLLDVTDVLTVGKNTIRIVYSSNVSNALGDGVPRGWYGYHTEKHSYGPSQAVLIPYTVTKAE